MSEPTNAQLAVQLSELAPWLEATGKLNSARLVRLAAQRLEGEISEAKVERAFDAYEAESGSQPSWSALRAALEAAREA